MRNEEEEAGMSGIRLMIVDDQDLIRESLQIVLNMDPELEVVGMAENGRVAIEMCERLMPDVMLLDIHMPVMDGVQATEEMKRRFPGVRVIILTTFQEVNYVVDALGAGAEGYLLKAIHPSDLAAGIKWVHRGGTLIPQEIAKMLVSRAKMNEQPPQAAIRNNYGLSDRESEILQLIAEGLTNKQIAAKLFLSEGTVKNYVSSLYTKLDVQDRNHAAQIARDGGL
jgi:DNA-binding NarL/FixJ family response regulator